MRGRLRHLSKRLPGFLASPGPAVLALESWKCSACDEYGVFVRGPAEHF